MAKELVIGEMGVGIWANGKREGQMALEYFIILVETITMVNF